MLKLSHMHHDTSWMRPVATVDMCNSLHNFQRSSHTTANDMSAALFGCQVLEPANAHKYAAMTLGKYLDSNGYSTAFKVNYVLPMCAAVWSVPTNQVRRAVKATVRAAASRQPLRAAAGTVSIQYNRYSRTRNSHSMPVLLLQPVTPRTSCPPKILLHVT